MSWQIQKARESDVRREAVDAFPRDDVLCPAFRTAEQASGHVDEAFQTWRLAERMLTRQYLRVREPIQTNSTRQQSLYSLRRVGACSFCHSVSKDSPIPNALSEIRTRNSTQVSKQYEVVVYLLLYGYGTQHIKGRTKNHN